MMCPTLSAPENGKLLTDKADHHFGDVVQFQCNFGYVISGSTSLICMSTGEWNSSAPECICKFEPSTFWLLTSVAI